MPLWRLAARQFRSLVVLLLLVAASIAWGLGERAEAIAILAALLLNAAIGAGTEWRAQVSLARLRALAVPTARVRRDGRDLRVPAASLVPGDVVVLDAGSHVPADARLVKASALRLDESPLTGESAAVAKSTDDALSADAPLAERTTMVYLATRVLAGSAVAVVTATGVATELGRIGQLVAIAGERTTPLERQVEHLGRRLVGLAIAVCALIAAVGILHGEPAALMLETAVSLAIAAIPEGLPAVTAVALAAGLWRLARAGALVRRLPVVETLGSTTVICADKTGTMTENRMTVVRMLVGDRTVDVERGDAGRGQRAGGRLVERGAPVGRGEDAEITRLLTVASLANDAALAADGGVARAEGDPTEIALLEVAVTAGLDLGALRQGWPRRLEIPFDPKLRFMATYHETPTGGRAALVKGAPGEILRRSSWREVGGRRLPLDEPTRDALLAANRQMAGRGLRVLAVAWRPDGWGDVAAPGDLAFLGFVGLVDPVRPGVKEALARCAAAGVKTVMLTGDQQSTAEAVGRELGIDAADIRSRMTPEGKLELIRELQDRGEIVAMTGDGVNDAPALTRADIGIAMGRQGTDVARDAADLVLTDDNFATIAGAVQEGRVIYVNLRKVIHFLFSCNLSEVATIFVAIAIGLPAPLLPLQILWVNLVTDILPALALIRDPASADVMLRPPRTPGEPIVTRAFALRILGEGALLAAGVLSAYVWVVSQDGLGARATTIAFLTLVLVHPIQAMHCRSERVPVWRLSRNDLALVAVVVLALAQWFATSWDPLARLLGTVPLAPIDWFVAFVAALWPVGVLETLKMVGRAASPAPGSG